MKHAMRSRKILGMCLAFLLATLACGMPSRQSTPFNPPPTSGPALATQTTAPLLPTLAPELPATQASSDPTATPIPESPTEAPPPPTVTNTPTCTALQNLFVRSGPGQAYDEIGELTAGDMVTPVGYNPQGIPAGSWVMIEDTANNQGGWISAEENFVSCNLDLTTLPTVEVAAPPQPVPPSSAKSGNEGGNCGEGFGYDCEVIITTDSFLQFRLLKKDGTEITQENGMIDVSFIVRSGSDENGAEVFSTVESTSAYCIFGGNGPCTGWTLNDGAYTWPNGTAVSSGDYFVRITATFEDNGSSDIVSWGSGFTITIP